MCESWSGAASILRHIGKCAHKEAYYNPENCCRRFYLLCLKNPENPNTSLEPNFPTTLHLDLLKLCGKIRDDCLDKMYSYTITDPMTGQPLNDYLPDQAYQGKAPRDSGNFPVQNKEECTSHFQIFTRLIRHFSRIRKKEIQVSLDKAQKGIDYYQNIKSKLENGTITQTDINKLRTEINKEMKHKTSTFTKYLKENNLEKEISTSPCLTPGMKIKMSSVTPILPSQESNLGAGHGKSQSMVQVATSSLPNSLPADINLDSSINSTISHTSQTSNMSNTSNNTSSFPAASQNPQIPTSTQNPPNHPNSTQPPTTSTQKPMTQTQRLISSNSSNSANSPIPVYNSSSNIAQNYPMQTLPSREQLVNASPITTTASNAINKNEIVGSQKQIFTHVVPEMTMVNSQMTTSGHSMMVSGVTEEVEKNGNGSNFRRPSLAENSSSYQPQTTKHSPTKQYIYHSNYGGNFQNGQKIGQNGGQVREVSGHSGNFKGTFNDFEDDCLFVTLNRGARPGR